MASWQKGVSDLPNSGHADTTVTQPIPVSLAEPGSQRNYALIMPWSRCKYSKNTHSHSHSKMDVPHWTYTIIHTSHTTHSRSPSNNCEKPTLKQTTPGWDFSRFAMSTTQPIVLCGDVTPKPTKSTNTSSTPRPFVPGPRRHRPGSGGPRNRIDPRHT